MSLNVKLSDPSLFWLLGFFYSLRFSNTLQSINCMKHHLFILFRHYKMLVWWHKYKRHDIVSLKILLCNNKLYLFTDTVECSNIENQKCSKLFCLWKTWILKALYLYVRGCNRKEIWQFLEVFILNYTWFYSIFRVTDYQKFLVA